VQQLPIIKQQYCYSTIFSTAGQFIFEFFLNYVNGRIMFGMAHLVN
jgi:hypothetical protein